MGEEMSPVFEFECHECGHVTDRFTHDYELDGVPCEECGSDTKRLLAKPRFDLRGAGFHCNDYHPDKVNTLDEFVNGKKGREYKSDEDIPEDL
jgi:putative FmdB family regulatory protein